MLLTLMNSSISSVSEKFEKIVNFFKSINKRQIESIQDVSFKNDVSYIKRILTIEIIHSLAIANQQEPLKSLKYRYPSSLLAVA